MALVKISEQEAREVIVSWARSYFSPEYGNETPEIEICSLTFDTEENEFHTELEVSTSADNPFITFWLDDTSGLQIVSIEY